MFQLLAVLPAASKQLLPDAYRELMTSANSELIHFYPSDFETDLNGKKQEWESVVLIPFIDEVNVLSNVKKKINLKLIRFAEITFKSNEELRKQTKQHRS